MFSISAPLGLGCVAEAMAHIQELVNADACLPNRRLALTPKQGFRSHCQGAQSLWRGMDME